MKLKNTKLTIKAGKTSKISGASITGVKSGRNIPKDTAKFRYATSDSAIATVDKKGVIRARKKGTCKIYVITVNGVNKAISITVK